MRTRTNAFNAVVSIKPLHRLGPHPNRYEERNTASGAKLRGTIGELVRLFLPERGLQNAAQFALLRLGKSCETQNEI